MGIFSKLGWFFKQEKKRYIIGITFLALTSLANLIPPRVLGLMADQLDKGHVSWSEYAALIIAVLAAAFTLYILSYFWRKQIWGGAAELERQMRSKLFDHFMIMDRTFYQRHRTGDLMAHATNDVSAIQNVAGDGVLTLVDSLVIGLSTMVAMIIFVDWRLTIVALLPLPFLALGAWKLGDHLHDAFDKSQAAFSRLNNKTQESITGIKVLKTFGQGKEDTAAFDKMVDDTIKINKKVFVWDSLFDPLGTAIIGATYAITIIYGGLLVNHHVLSIGQLVSFIAYISNMVWPMFAIGYLFNILERGSASYDRVEKLLQEKPLITDAHADNTLSAEDLQGDLDYQIKSFAYPDEKDIPVLKNIDFKLRPGQTLGLVGRVGARKTTIIELLLREFDQYDGQITLNGKDIRTIPLKLLLSQISYVPQNNFLFSTSIGRNIAFSSEDADQEDIALAAQKSDLHEDVLKMPKGYQTLVGENGLSLSGGQRQRMSIARAVLKDTHILILDDALSAVDAKTETEILSALRKERENKTTMIAAHRLTSVMDADLILVLKNGQIVERGNHQQLLAENGWYAEMWRRQENGGEDINE
ncbi:ABC transporter ATP-binding protein [Lactobacillus helveticus]|uniref:ABC transporter ATP-binding protein n=1 Tax=Lactobacillus helveticus TaxID=1587 RepID=UPI000CD930C8|nr:ABC transporter transmembrane domain-containing protein [Lactobacillus helveticus]MBO1881698.1 ATP-binding cassette domain-containing protein [Lactobacillus helveticus]POO31698.1 putative multidrug resistance ABC transporter ATP-binding/permease protein YheI [Lactobacillus helveticus]QYH33457.1 ATP-binding cassette domain-containing protein [Lactobacillus helveticus]GFP09120.1 ABC transporter ATP-binding protein [Lactobacillus helveticus]GFP17777.1 ABC transporter ATP-binding protein [Lacto